MCKSFGLLVGVALAFGVAGVGPRHWAVRALYAGAFVLSVPLVIVLWFAMDWGNTWGYEFLVAEVPAFLVVATVKGLLLFYRGEKRT